MGVRNFKTNEDRFTKEQCKLRIFFCEISLNPVATLPIPKPQYCEAVREKDSLPWFKDDKAGKEGSWSGLPTSPTVVIQTCHYVPVGEDRCHVIDFLLASQMIWPQS